MLEKITGENNAINLIDLGLIQISGKDAKQFLQGQLTCDLEEISAEQSRLGAHCDVKGRIIASFRLFFYQNEYYLLLQHSTLPLLLASLKKYAVFSKVALRDASKDWQKIGLYGLSIKVLFNEQKLYSDKENGVTESDHKLSLSIPGPTPRCILLAPASEPLSFIDTKFEQQSVDHWHLLDIMTGIPTIYPETSGQFTPHQLNFPEIGGVSFNKGCYIGQEIIARTHYLGKSKSRLYRVSFQADNPHLPGTPLFDNDQKTEKGTLIMCAKERDNRYQALACLQNQAISHSIRLGSLEGPLVDFLELPYSTH
jgi:tRNA-modifying protein YgfZ